MKFTKVEESFLSEAGFPVISDVSAASGIYRISKLSGKQWALAELDRDTKEYTRIALGTPGIVLRKACILDEAESKNWTFTVNK